MKMNKLIASLLAVSLLAFPVVQVSADENISLTVNGEKVETQVPPTIIDGRTMEMLKVIQQVNLQLIYSSSFINSPF